ncbi:hypothetical protein ACPCUV_02155 [Streptomyces platensis]|uniref:hypothetical protein n=1 Tax=Streptomyces platensis TaxID=58346 RepID=UPI003C2E39EC
MALVTANVELDAPGITYGPTGLWVYGPTGLRASRGTREAIAPAHPRPDVRRHTLPVFHTDPAHRPKVTSGNTRADAPDCREDHYTHPNFVRIIEDSPWPE